MISALIDTLVAGERADPAALEQALHRIMLGEVTDAQTAGLLVALRVREPDAPTLAACARVLRAHRLAVEAQVRPLIDTCGTGGDRSNTFNISTAAALVVAACGGAVAKHGNRSVSSRAGSADALEAAGCVIEVDPRQAQTLLDATGFVFLFAPSFHPATANVAPIRRALGVRTLFNLLGPLSNPALAEYQLVGVYDPAMTQVMAQALAELGTTGALVVHCDGLDEIGLHAQTHGHLVRDGEVVPYSIDPAVLGFAAAPISALKGGEAAENAAILGAVLDGETGPRADVVALNAGAALFVGGLADTLEEGISQAREALGNQSAARVLMRYAESSTRALAESAA